GPDTKDPQDRRSAAPSPGGESDAKPPLEGCTPKCGAACGTDDGCGSKCGCERGLECKEGVCLDPSCGPCRPNERCNAGKCECVPDCEGRACRDDGCGGQCQCPDGTVLNPQQQPVPRDQCKDTCGSAHFQCGEVCGVNCGTCGEGQACDAGVCKCAPKCDGTSCSDGCGGSCDCAGGTVCNAGNSCVKPAECKDTCESTGLRCGSICGQECGSCGNGQSCVDGQCREGVSCADCGLQIRLLERQVLANKIVRTKIAVDYQATSEETGPRLVDTRIGADHVVNLVEAEPGPALIQTGKDLFVDETTHRAWQEKPDESFQLLAYSVSGTLRVKSGRLVTLTFDLAEPGPVRFSLLRHAQTFAPLDADNALQSSKYEQPLVVTR
ncbi:MAG TPA: hypothetical protein VFQ61_13965, partial [Polyangiaceae bacterium]|nr:hypothetical protein [Polyangiaceae bacterium]